MDFYIAAATDAGIKRQNNQDNLMVEQFMAGREKVVFAVLCDGMGGLSHGEIASESIVSAFSAWARSTLRNMPEDMFCDHRIRAQWTELIRAQNDAIRAYGQQNNYKLGSTVTALLLTQTRYYILNAGDSRAYELCGNVRQLTRDHTVLADEIQLGNLSEEQARYYPMQNVLTKCVGVSECVYPDFFFGNTRTGAVYLLCSDGFRRCIAPEEMLDRLTPRSGGTISWLKAANESLIELNKQRGETDNISVITIYAAG